MGILMFEPPDVQHFVNDVPFFLHTPLMWTETVQAVNHMDEYKRVQGCGLLQQYES